MRFIGNLAGTRAAGFLVAALVASPGSIAAEPVRINDGLAQGFMVAHAANCYVVLPGHAVEPGGWLAVATVEPAQNGSGIAFEPFWPGIDLAVATVRRGVLDRCTDSAERLLSGRLDAVTQSRGEMLMVQADGQVRRLPMRIDATGYLDFTATMINPPEDDSVFQGMSGSFFFIDGSPVGMALEDVGPSTVRFIRIEEIALNLRRWLGSEAARFESAPDPADAPALGGKGHALSLLDAQTAAVDAHHMAENVLGEGGYVFLPHGPARLVFGVGGDAAAELRRVVMRSDPSAGQAVPKAVRIEVDSVREGPGRWRLFWSGEMTRDGVLDTGARGGTLARRIRITILSAWSPGPARLDSVTAR